MFDLGKLGQLEFTWDEFEREILPHLMHSQTRFFMYRGGKLLNVNECFREAFAFEDMALDQIDATLWHDEQEHRRFGELIERALATSKALSDRFLVSNGKGKQISSRIQSARVSIQDQEPICACFLLGTGELSLGEKIFGVEDEELFRIVAEQSLNGIALLDDRLHVLYANPAALAIYGLGSLEEARQLSFLNTLAPESLKQVIERVQNWLEGHPNPPRVHYKIIRKDGAKRDLESISSIVNVGGKRCHLNSIIDVTERVQAETALRESEVRYRNLVETSPDGIVVTDLTGTILMVNEQAAVMVGAGRPEDLVGRTAFEFMGPEDRPRALADIERTRISKITRNAEYDCLRLDGTIFPVEINASLVNSAAGQPTGLILVIRNTTERKEAEKVRQKLEAQLHQAQKLEAIGLLAGGIAHDLNNLLTVIISNSETLQTTLADQPLSAELAEQSLNSGQRASDLIRKLTTFARKGQLQKVPVNLHQLIGEVGQMLERTLDKQISVKQDFHAEAATALGDPSQLRSAILNLALNARDAMPHGGKLTFATANVSLDPESCRRLGDALAPGDYLQISVADTGVGMSEETQTHAFEPFYTTKETGKGTGLGLASVYGCIQSCQGAIQLQSQLGQGTTFTIFLPLAETKAVEIGPRPAPRSEARGGQILVVDDEELVLKSVSRILKSLGYQVATFHDGATAVQYYRSHPQKIDLVILDMMMPKPNGKEIFLQLKQIDPQVKGLLFTGYSVDRDAREMFAQGLVGVVSKPFSREELAQAVFDAVRK